MKIIAVHFVGVALAFLAMPVFADDAAPSDPFGNGTSSLNANSSAVTRLGPNAPLVATMGSKAYLKIETELHRNTSVSFEKVPLSDALQAISKAHQIPIAIDEQSLSAKQVDPRIPVSLHLKNLALRSALTIMLSELKLDYLFKDDIIQVKTKEDVERESQTIIYPIESLGKQGDDLAAFIQETLTAKHSYPMPIPVVKLVRDSDSDVQMQTLLVNANRSMHSEVQRVLHSLENSTKR